MEPQGINFNENHDFCKLVKAALKEASRISFNCIVEYLIDHCILGYIYYKSRRHIVIN